MLFAYAQDVSKNVTAIPKARKVLSMHLAAVVCRLDCVWRTSVLQKVQAPRTGTATEPAMDNLVWV